MSRKRINTARDRRKAKDRGSKLGIFVVSTDEGVAIELGEGSSSVRLDMGVDKAIEVASTIMVAILPAATRDGETIESLGDKFFMLLTEKCQMVTAQLDAMPS
ncbi:MAG: hypothetical protein IPM54_24895 [Polyangiaceae bacterium]|nr:hypothetical protein [Polyangiaceae bacterium]